MIKLNKASPVSNLITTNQVDTDVNNDDDSQYFATPQKRNHSATEICDTNNKTAQVQIKLNHHLCQLSPSTLPKSLKPPTSGKTIFVLKWTQTYSHATECAKSRSLNEFIDSIVDI